MLKTRLGMQLNRLPILLALVATENKMSEVKINCRESQHEAFVRFLRYHIQVSENAIESRVKVWMLGTWANDGGKPVRTVGARCSGGQRTELRHLNSPSELPQIP